MGETQVKIKKHREESFIIPKYFDFSATFKNTDYLCIIHKPRLFIFNSKLIFVLTHVISHNLMPILFKPRKQMIETEFLIVGAGIIGLTLARELISQGVSKIILIEKESGLGFHASGRNSGVLHAGIYYPPHTLKAKICLQGNLLLQEFCQQKKLPLKQCGKVIVARNKAELPMLNQLLNQARLNGAKVDLIDEVELAKHEPHAKTYCSALYSHYTALVNNKSILKALEEELEQTGKVQLLFQTEFKTIQGEKVAVTKQGKIQFDYLVNTAGAYADKVAHCFGLAKEYYFIPFKGIYQKLIPEKSHLVNGNIYPIPNLENPFLGVHFSKDIDGNTYIGPTAIPAFGRENYGYLKGIDHELPRIIFNELLMCWFNKQFRKVAWEESKKYFKRYVFQDARQLVKQLELQWLMKSRKVGLRPQLMSLKDKKLMMDFLVIKDKHTLHILNAISPAFTSSMFFAKYIVKEYLQKG